MRLPRLLLLPALLLPGLALLASVAVAHAEPSLEPVPQAVPVSVDEVAVAGVDPAALGMRAGTSSVRLADGRRRLVLLTAPRETRPFSMVGLTWDRTEGDVDVEGWVRTRSAGGWSGWTSLGGPADGEPDRGSPDVAGTVRDGTAPLATEPADAVQARLDASGPTPTGLRLVLLDPGTSPADDAAAQSELVDTGRSALRSARPAIRSRARWGADESIRTGRPAYAPAVRAVVIHHTASTNDYAPADVPRLLRGFYAYHVQSRGWSDIGYNVLVDRFGTAWEGRAGGLDRAVIGSHAGGFNTGTAGISCRARGWRCCSAAATSRSRRCAAATCSVRTARTAPTSRSMRTGPCRPSWAARPPGR